MGQEARIEIVDAGSDGWGHINVDQIEFRDEPLSESLSLPKLPDFGSMAIAVVGGGDTAVRVSLPADGRSGILVCQQGCR